MREPERDLVWSLEAEQDLLSIWHYGADEWSPDVADEHERTLWRACQRLLDNPELGRSRDELIAGLRSTLVDPHTIFYRLSPRTIEIVRVLHHREDIEPLFQ
jgi:toxin ParE1/3/4